jgi:unsaturated rhamnogalacturonyl hydrolase
MKNFPLLVILGVTLPCFWPAHEASADDKLLQAVATAPQDGDLTHWPVGKSPQEVGALVANHFIATPHPNFGSPRPPAHITYPEVCAWIGALTFAKSTGDEAMSQKLADRFIPLFGEEKNLVPIPNHVDNTVFGGVPLELYIETKDRKYLDMGQDIADQQWAPPKPDNVQGQKYFELGLTKQTRLWIDDMYMITSVQTQAYRATDDPKYIDRAAKEMVYYLHQLQKPNGLFFHGPDVPIYWGRGNGWVAVGMAEILRSLPLDNPSRPRILEGYKKMMASLLQFQGQDGMWRQLIDDPQAWPETSCTGMFTFAMITGVKNGWLDAATYAPTARKGWLGLVTYINAEGDITNVCEGTGKKNDRQFYLDRKRLTGDMHGQAPVLWCATALLR